MASAFLTQVIAKNHDVTNFQCTKPALAEYIRRYARQTSARGGARTFVATAEDDPDLVIGFYTLVPSEITSEAGPQEVRRGLGRYPVPGFRLARLAVDTRVEGRGLGTKLLLDAGMRCLHAAEQVGGKLMFIDAKDDMAAKFYIRIGAIRLADTPLVLILPLDTIKAAIEQMAAAVRCELQE